MCRSSAIFFVLLFTHGAFAGGVKLTIRDLPSPAGERSGEANLWTHQGKLAMSWIESEDSRKGALHWAVFDGKNWSDPRLVYRGDKLFINWADFPKMASHGQVTAAAWLEMLGEGTYAYGARAVISHDGGRTWGAPFWLHEDRTRNEHGFVSFAPAGKDQLAAIWLDSRAMGDAEGGHGEGQGAMQLMSRVIGPDGLGPETAVDDQTCECCNTDLIATGDGLLAAFRDRSDAHIRDIHLARLKDGRWRQLGAIRADGWEIHGCPVNGPALAASGETVAAAWFTGAQDQPRVWLAASADAGARFSAQISVADAPPMGRVDCVIENGLIWVSWMAMNGAVKLAAYSFEEELVPEGGPWTLSAGSAARAAGFPRLAAFKGTLFMAIRDAEAARVAIKAIVPRP